MTTITDDGFEALADVLIGLTQTRIDAIAVGTATGSEVQNASTLGNEVFRADKSDPKTSFADTGSGGQLEITIAVTGGTDVPANTQITELGVFEDGANGNGRLTVIDQVPAVTVENGDIEQFTVPVDVNSGI
jgi:hypothetical protein